MFRVNQAHPKLEKSRMFYLDDVIIALKSNFSFASLIEKRASEFGGFIYIDAQFDNNSKSDIFSENDFENRNCYKHYSLVESLQEIQNIPHKLIDNPFYKVFPPEKLISNHFEK